jgi:hypothetical protein
VAEAAAVAREVSKPHPVTVSANGLVDETRVRELVTHLNVLCPIACPVEHDGGLCYAFFGTLGLRHSGFNRSLCDIETAQNEGSRR